MRLLSKFLGDTFICSSLFTSENTLYMDIRQSQYTFHFINNYLIDGHCSSSRHWTPVALTPSLKLDRVFLFSFKILVIRHIVYCIEAFVYVALLCSDSQQGFCFVSLTLIGYLDFLLLLATPDILIYLIYYSRVYTLGSLLVGLENMHVYWGSNPGWLCKTSSVRTIIYYSHVWVILKIPILIFSFYCRFIF